MPIIMPKFNSGAGLTYGPIIFAAALANPGMWQEDNATPGAVGTTMFVHAQNATGGGGSIGGLLRVAGGSGNTHGSVSIEAGLTGNVNLEAAAVNLYSSAVTFDETQTPVISQAARTSNDLTHALVITSQAPMPGATGANRASGNINLTVPPSAAGGSPGSITGNIAGATIIDISNIGVRSGTTFWFASSLATAKLYQADLTTAAATGNPLTIQAQNATGAGATGGNLVLTSGTGTASAGLLYAQCGGTNVLAAATTQLITYVPISQFQHSVISPILGQQARTTDSPCQTLSITSQAPLAGSTGANRNPGNLTLIVPTPAAGGTAGYCNVMVSGASQLVVGASYVQIGPSNVYWGAGTGTPKIYQADDTTNSATGDTLTIQAQNCTGLTSNGGALYLTSGTGTSANGYVYIQTGGVTKLTVASAYAQIASTVYVSGNVQIEKAIVSGAFCYQARTTDAVCNALSLYGQEPFATATGANRVPGDVICKVGTPTNAGTTHGTWRVNVAGGDVLLASKDAAGNASLGFFGTAPIVKPDVAGSRAANAALASLCTALANLGLITDSTVV